MSLFQIPDTQKYPIIENISGRVRVLLKIIGSGIGYPSDTAHVSLSIVLIPIKRPCDSRNLNLNPLCMLETGTLPKLWTDRVNNYSKNNLKLHFTTR